MYTSLVNQTLPFHKLIINLSVNEFTYYIPNFLYNDRVILNETNVWDELCKNTNIQVLWASTREVYNIFQAIEYGCDIITIPDDVLKRTKYIGKDLTEYSIETVKTFCEDSLKSNISFNYIFLNL